MSHQQHFFWVHRRQYPLSFVFVCESNFFQLCIHFWVSLHAQVLKRWIYIPSFLIHLHCHHRRLPQFWPYFQLKQRHLPWCSWQHSFTFLLEKRFFQIFKKLCFLHLIDLSHFFEWDLDCFDKRHYPHCLGSYFKRRISCFQVEVSLIADLHHHWDFYWTLLVICSNQPSKCSRVDHHYHQCLPNQPVIWIA